MDGRFATAGALLALTLLILTGCDSTSGQKSAEDSGTTGQFTAEIAGAVRSTLQGGVTAHGGAWNGSAFRMDLGCDFSEWDDDLGDDGDIFDGGFGDDDGDGELDDDGFFEDCDDRDLPEGFAAFHLELVPGGSDANDPDEVIFLAFEGQLEAGTFPIILEAYDDSTDVTDDGLDSGSVWAEYLHFPSEQTFEEYQGIDGVLTLSSVADNKLSGNFSFSSDQCFCANETQLDELESELDSLLMTLDPDDDSQWEQIDQAFDNIYNRFLVPKSITVDGSFQDVPIQDESVWADSVATGG